MTQPIWYDSTEAGAPTLNNVAGSMLEVLRACLVNGFGAKAALSISVTSGLATLTSAAHGFTAKYGKLVQVAGCSENLLNGLKQPLTVGTNEITFTAPGVADGTYGGSITVKRPGLGWSEEFNAGNVSVFKRLATDSTAQKLLVNDSHANGSTATDARIQIVETADSTTVFTGAVPSTAGYWTKGLNSTVAKQWAVVGDGRFFWLFTTHANSAQAGVYTMTPYYFGDPISYHSPDPFATVASYATAANPSGGVGGVGGCIYIAAPNDISGLAVSRNRLGAGGGISFGQCGATTSFNPGAIGGQSGTTNMTTVVISEPVYAIESDGTYRGEIPGLAAPLAYTPFDGGGQLQIIQPTALSPSAYLVVLHVSVAKVGTMLINLTEWRR